MRRARRRPRFVRFVCGGLGEDPFSLTGVFSRAETLRVQDRLAPYEEEAIFGLIEWFNEHLPVPPFEDRLASGAWTRDAVSWFRDGAVPMIRLMWALAALLREHGEPVRFFQTAEPGRIVYADDVQIVSETGRYGRGRAATWR